MRRVTAARGVGIAVALLALPALGWGQEAQVGGAEKAESAPRPAPAAASARREANLVRVNGKATVLLWARGVTSEQDLDAYVAAGFNTLAVPITGGSKEAREQAFALASAAEERGLYLVGLLAPEQLTDAESNAVAIDPVLDSYPEAVRAFAQSAVAEFGSHPRLLAWVVDISADEVVWGDPGFRAFLARAYPDLDALNASWGSAYESFDDIEAAGLHDLEADRTGGVGRGSVDYAYYRQQTYREAMGAWEKALRESDGRRLILAGGVTDYRSAISLGSDFDGTVMETTSAHAEPDYATANVQAVDIARRANTRVAVQSLDISASPSASALRNWIDLALLHGASGIQVESWSDLKDSDDLVAAMKEAVRAISANGHFPTKPVARAAVLYEPYAGGAMREGKSLYGYIDGLTEREPTDVFFSVRNGSRYGLMDVLPAEALSEADLKEYGALLVPMAFYLTDDAQATLNDFATRGGLLVADAGVGMYQAKGEVGSVPEILRDTFGLMEATEEPAAVEQPQGGVTYINPDTNQPQIVGGTTVQHDLRSEKDLELAIRELYGLLTEPDVAKYLGKDFGGPESPGLRARKVGKGVAVYAPVFLYQQWSPEAESYADFHDRVLGWRYELRIEDPDELWPAVEASRASDGTVSLVTAGSSAAVVQSYGEAAQVYRVPRGAVRVWEPSTGSPVELFFPGELLATAEPLPIYVTPQEEGAGAVVQVVSLTAGKLVLDIAGDGAVVTPSEGELVVQGGKVTTVKVEVLDGPFRVTSGTSYHVTLEDNGRNLADYAVMPDQATKSIVVTNQFRATRLTIEAASTGSGGG